MAAPWTPTTERYPTTTGERPFTGSSYTPATSDVEEGCTEEVLYHRPPVETVFDDNMKVVLIINLRDALGKAWRKYEMLIDNGSERKLVDKAGRVVRDISTWLEKAQNF